LEVRNKERTMLRDIIIFALLGVLIGDIFGLSFILEV